MVQYANRRKSMTYIIDCMHNIMASLTNKELISFGGGAPAKEAYPLELIQQLSKLVLEDESKAMQAFSYGSTIGLPSFRKEIQKNLLAPNGLDTSLDQVMVTAGGIQALYLVCMLYLNPGDIILVESPTFVHAKLLFDSFEVICKPCLMENDGLNLVDLERKIQQYSPKMIYTIPTFQNPTGITMSVEKRKQLAAIVDRYDVMLLEDDPYSEIRYSGKSIKPIKSYSKSRNIIYANSLSKIFSPGARLGYLVADSGIIQELSEMKLAVDTCTNGFTQAICAEFFGGGYYKPHLENLCSLYKSRRDTMQVAIDKYFPKGTKRTSPDGGYYIWVELPDGLDGRQLLPIANEEIGITYGSGSDFFVEENNNGNQYLRLSFAGVEEKIIEESIEKLGAFFYSKI